MLALQLLWEDFFREESEVETWWTPLKKLYDKQKITIVRIQGVVKDWRVYQKHSKTIQQYTLHVTFLLKQGKRLYIEEREYEYEFYERDGNIKRHRQIPQVETTAFLEVPQRDTESVTDRSYDRRKAVQYAERWWNDYNPSFRTFEVDCTNYISQCLLAGGGWMYGEPSREDGWWYSGASWSFSWAVAHSMRWYLSSSTKSIVGTEVARADQLQLGDVICYDFDGGGRWDHTTIVVAKDIQNMPLVNAHTDNSRHRYWSYEDSTAWTPNIAYKFFHIQIK